MFFVACRVQTKSGPTFLCNEMRYRGGSAWNYAVRPTSRGVDPPNVARRNLCSTGTVKLLTGHGGLHSRAVDDGQFGTTRKPRQSIESIFWHDENHIVTGIRPRKTILGGGEDESCYIPALALRDFQLVAGACNAPN